MGQEPSATHYAQPALPARCDAGMPSPTQQAHGPGDLVKYLTGADRNNRPARRRES